MIRRALAACFAAAVATAGAQTVLPGHAERAFHDRALLAEDAAALVDAWDGASPLARERMAQHLTPRRGGALAWPEPEAIARALRAARGDEIAPEGSLAALADALDLMVTPGVAPPRTERHEPGLTVRVWRRWNVEPAHDVEVSLVAVDPEGRETLLRRAPAAPAAFRAPGFDLYARLPERPAGTWWLALELARDDERARTRAVAIETLDGVAELSARIAEDDGFAARVLGAELERARRHGVRAAHGIPVAARLAADAASPVPDPLGGVDVDEPAWRFAPDGGATALAVVFAPPARDAAEPFRGAVGARWRAFAERHRVELVSVRCDVPRIEPILRAALEEAVAGGLELIVVVRTGAAVPVLLTLRAIEGDERWTRVSPRLALVLPGMPTTSLGAHPRRVLVVAPGAPLALAPGDGRFATAPMGPDVLLDDAAWPVRLGEWLDARSRAEDDG